MKETVLGMLSSPFFEGLANASTRQLARPQSLPERHAGMMELLRANPIKVYNVGRPIPTAGDVYFHAASIIINGLGMGEYNVKCFRGAFVNAAATYAYHGGHQNRESAVAAACRAIRTAMKLMGAAF